MPIPAWRRWLGPRDATRPKPSRARRAGAKVESLEGRQLLATSPVLGVLTAHLDPASDNGFSNADAITTDRQPRFLGAGAPPGSLVIIDAIPAGDPSAPSVAIGLATADDSGAWAATSAPLAVGAYQVAATVVASTPTGSTTFTSNVQSVVIAPASPAVSSVQFRPLTGQVQVTVSDPANTLDLAALTDPGNYSLVPRATRNRGPGGDPSRPDKGVVLVPRYRVTGVSLVPNAVPGLPQVLTVTINNNQPIRAGFYRFTIKAAGITNAAGNALDGEFRGVFPSGDGTPGGDFVADLAEVHNSVQPPLPVAPVPAGGTGSATGAKASTAFVPSTGQVLVRVFGNNNKVQRLLGGGQANVAALAHQNFPGTYRLPQAVGGQANRPVKKVGKPFA